MLVRKGLVALLAAGVLAGGGAGALVLTDEGGTPLLPRPEPAASPYPTRGPLLGASRAGAAPTEAGLLRALGGVLDDPRLGSRLSLSVLDVGTGRALLDLRGDREAVPASTTKLATAAAVLAVLPRDRRFTTTVVAGERPGEVVLVGGGDPTLGGKARPTGHVGATLDQLARQLRARKVQRVLVDDSLFTGPAMGPGWKAGYVDEGSVAPVSALEVDGGRRSRKDSEPRASDPAIEAGRQLAALLGASRSVERVVAPRGARLLARAASPPVQQLVERMLTRSDNDLAEALGRHVALATKRPASFEGESDAVREVLRKLGVTLDLRDTSGLSRENRVRPAQVARLLARVARDGRFAPLLTGLPVAGFDGTLEERYRKGAARAAAGEVRAKTGTLDGVSALAGYVRTRSGRLLAFDITADGVRLGGTAAAQRALDGIATTLARCGCA